MQDQHRIVSPMLDSTLGDRAICRGESCRQVIYWRILPSGKRCPFNANGSVHWSTCPDSREFKKSHKCRHSRLNEDGICRSCGADCRGIG